MATVRDLQTSILFRSPEEQLEMINTIRENRFIKKKRTTLKRPERNKLKKKVSVLSENEKQQLREFLLNG